MSMKVLKCIFCIMLFIILFIWAGCNVDISSWMDYRNVVIVDKHYDWDLLSDDWYISVKYDDTVKVIEVTKETYMSYQIGDSVYIDICTGKRL